MDLNEQKNGLERSLQEDDANRLETPGARSVAHGIDYGVITNQFKYVCVQEVYCVMLDVLTLNTTVCVCVCVCVCVYVRVCIIIVVSVLQSLQ